MHTNETLDARPDANELGSSVIDLAQFAVPRAVRIEGSGTEALLAALADKVGDACAAGAKPNDVRVLCASPQAALAIAPRLKRALAARGLDCAAQQIDVSSVRAVALDVLAAPRARVATGRDFAGDRARVLLPYELDVVVEDLKTWGSRPKRLRKMLDFMYRGFTELADENPRWLFTVEEIEVRKILVDDLRYLGAVIEPEVSNLACKALRAEPGLRREFGAAHVFVAGYQNLSRASQLLCHLLAGESLTVAVNPAACVEVYDSYPYAAGYDEFLQINPAAECLEAGGDDGLGVVERMWDNPEAEYAGVADLVAAMVGEGRDPSGIAVVCFDPVWHSRIGRALMERGVPVCGLYKVPALRGDITDVRRSLAVRVATALRIVADARDSVAWRCWMGFDDELAHSTEFGALRQAGLTDGRRALLADDLAGWDGYEASTRFFDTCQGKAGFELLAYLTWALTGDESARLPSQLAALRKMGDDATAAQMIAWIDQSQLAACYSSGGVTVCSLPMLEGQSFECVVLAGFVNGALPAREFFDYAASTVDQRKKMEQVDVAKAAHLRAAATREIVASSYEHVSADEAQKLRLKVDRVALDIETGERLAHVSPSILLPLLRA